GFFHYSGAESFAGINIYNYINFLLFGILVLAFFNIGTNIFTWKFREEKYWKTIEAIFIAPINYLSIIIGTGISEFIRLIPTMLLFLCMASFFIMPSVTAFILSITMLLMVFLISLSAGLIRGSVTLGSENYDAVFSYLFAAWTLLSCFIYPIGIIPAEFRLFILVNPVYQGVNFIRDMWINGIIHWDGFLYVLGFALLMPAVSVIIFKFAWKRLGIHGY
ncbi:MAG: ABC transporter permease, partial [archaeon]